MQDARFDALSRDPRFMKVKRSHTKVKIDERFKHVIEDDDFAVDGGSGIGSGKKKAVDKYGRKMGKAKQKNNGLGRMYKLEDEDEEKEDRSGNNKSKVEKQPEEEEEEKKKKNNDSSNKKMSRFEFLTKLAKGEISDVSSSGSEDDESEGNEAAASSSEEDDSGEEEEEEPDETLKELDKPEMTQVASNRLAVMNCDWSHLRAVDILAAFQSFIPPSGSIRKACVYLSHFGKEKLEYEKTHGPKVGMNETEAFSVDKLRKYEKSKLKYYFAVLECDSPETVNALYEQCDGIEFERSSVIFDLRIIPDDVVIDTPMRDSAEQVPFSYKPPEFYSKALQHSKVDLTWDGDDDFEREDILTSWGKEDRHGASKATDKEVMLSAFIASSASEDEGSSEDEKTELLKTLKSENKTVKGKQVRNKYAALFGKSESQAPASSTKVDDKTSTETKKKNKNKDDGDGDDDAGDESVALQSEKKEPIYERKPENRIKLLKKNKKGARAGDDEEKEANESFEIDTKDERFAEVFQDPSFQLDRTDPNYKETPGLMKIAEERTKRKHNTVSTSTETTSDEMSNLVASIKSKSKKRKAS